MLRYLLVLATSTAVLANSSQCTAGSEDGGCQGSLSVADAQKFIEKYWLGYLSAPQPRGISVYFENFLALSRKAHQDGDAAASTACLTADFSTALKYVISESLAITQSLICLYLPVGSRILFNTIRNRS